MIDDILRKIGLTDYESKVYLALLDLGKATSGDILNKAELRTGKIYEILNSLKNKGLVSEIVESGVKKFFPADPKRIHDYLNEKKAEIERQEKDFDKILPDLLNKINSKKQEIHLDVFYGIKGLKTAYLKELEYHKKGQILYVIGVMEQEYYHKGIYDFFVYNLYPKRDKAGIKTKKIYSKTTKKQNRNFEKNSEIRYINYSSPVSILVIDKLTIIGIHSKEILISITIESKEVADSFIQQFNLMWKIASN
ncbi:MAG: TrmB family transcriptional regulator [Nanoarchaeota archaeon]